MPDRGRVASLVAWPTLAPGLRGAAAAKMAAAPDGLTVQARRRFKRSGQRRRSGRRGDEGFATTHSCAERSGRRGGR
jgi:hypothetical protein